MKNNNQLDWEKEFVEKGAAMEHDRWARWHHYSRMMSTPKHIKMWDRKAELPYIVLTEQEKESDRKETRKYLPLVKEALKQQRETLYKEIEGMREELAELEHKQWMYWRNSVIGKSYAGLTEEEKDKSRKWADKTIQAIIDKLKCKQ